VHVAAVSGIVADLDMVENDRVAQARRRESLAGHGGQGG